MNTFLKAKILPDIPITLPFLTTSKGYLNIRALHYLDTS